MKEEKFDLNDILIVPAIETTINSRDEVDPYYHIVEYKHLPLFTAPMDTVVDINNYKTYLNDDINICFPRNGGNKELTMKLNLLSRTYNSINSSENQRGKYFFRSIGLNEFKEEFLYETSPLKYEITILIDIANGHLRMFKDYIKEAKRIHGDMLTIMAGNIANPKTYVELSNAGANMIRIGIGNGASCLTTQNTSLGYSLGSLINECKKESKNLNNPAKIIADGGMKNYSDIIKALCLGSDYVMIGSIFNKAIESSGFNYWKGIKLSQSNAEYLYKRGFKIQKKFRGMSTKGVQRDWGKGVIRTSEGITTKRYVEYTLNQWIENFIDYLKSAMSYTNSRTLKEFIGNVEYIKITRESYNRFKK